MATVTTKSVKTTYSLELSEDEARTLLAVLDGDGDAAELRNANQGIYDIANALGRVLEY